jgi:hypothetical protein
VPKNNKNEKNIIGLKELSTHEQTSTNGGGILVYAFLAGVIIGYLHEKNK